MRVNLRSFMKMAGEKFKVFRDGKEIGSIEGMQNTEKNTNRKYIGFYPESDIQPEDWIVGELSGNEFYIEDTKTDVIQGSVFQKKGYYLTRVQYEKSKQSIGNVTNQFKISNVYGSILGSTGNNAINNAFNFDALDKVIDEKGGDETQELKDMIKEIRELLDDSEKVKKGSLSKYSELMEKHSWITGAVAQLGLGFLTGQMFQ